MSKRNDIADWIVDRLRDRVAALRDVVKAKVAAEVAQILNNPPSAAIIVGVPRDTGQYPDTISQYVAVPVVIYYSAEEYTGIETADEYDGAYQLFDEIHAAITAPSDDTPTVPPLPTGADTPLRLVDGDTTALEDGFVIESVSYEVMITI